MTHLFPLLLVANSAFAGPTKAAMTPKQRALHAVVSIEVRTAEALHVAVAKAIDEKSYKVGDACKAGHDQAKVSIAKGKDLKAKNQWRDAYKAYRQGTSSLKPCVEEFSDAGAPPALRTQVVERMKSSDDAVKAVHDMIEANANPKANAHHQKAKELREQMKAKVQAKQHKQAVGLWFSSMYELEQAVWTATTK